MPIPNRAVNSDVTITKCSRIAFQPLCVNGAKLKFVGFLHEHKRNCKRHIDRFVLCLSQVRGKLIYHTPSTNCLVRMCVPALTSLGQNVRGWGLRYFVAARWDLRYFVAARWGLWYFVAARWGLRYFVAARWEFAVFCTWNTGYIL